MSNTTSLPYDPDAVGAALENIIAGLERVTAGLSNLKLLFGSEDQDRMLDFDPKDPANKYEVGGIEKLTERGVEICYRLFDAGKSRYAVATLMEISHGAATHRYNAWLKAGGVNRVKRPLD